VHRDLAFRKESDMESLAGELLREDPVIMSDYD
jgi:hypothetical protein